MVKTIVASFDGYETAQKVVQKLLDDGFMSRDISILASNISGVYRAEGDGTVKLTDYGITAPSQFGVKPLNDVKFHIDFMAKANGGAQ